TRDAPLPKIGGSLRHKLEELVQITAGLLEMAKLKLFETSQLVNLRPSRLQFQGLIKVGHRLGVLPIFGIKSAPHVIRLGVGRAGGDRLRSENQSLPNVAAALGSLGSVQELVSFAICPETET